MKYLVLISVALFFLTGCSGFGKKLKSWIQDDKPQAQQLQQKSAAPSVSFNQQPYMDPGPRRQYKRQTRETLENESRLDDRTNSLWVMEGQGAYLFSQNIVRMIGDALSVQLDGEPKTQLESKAKVIKDLVKKIEARKAAKARRLASKTNGKEDSKKSESGAAANAPGNNGPDDEDILNVKSIPTRIVERMVDGNYRVKGSQPFMIDKYQYKVIVTGIIRSEDFNSEGVSATKLLDPNFDIVSARKNMAEM
ncbi:MAG: flagellar biosynthesis protein FlgH [Bdellovibrionaceae bacterium]|nr:flagellar biosynthesis protein FlgH [Pseudobdellovibrionaceae bacterium]|tara:strand:+ start:369 stop:1121 length:753 start_codon:yes stop_codon:yes gene_type:complete